MHQHFWKLNKIASTAFWCLFVIKYSYQSIVQARSYEGLPVCVPLYTLYVGGVDL